MSRVLKFRAWDKKKNRWAREWDRDLKDREDQAYEKEYSEDSYWLDGDVASDLDLVNGRLSLDRYIWEQYTGLKDKNGKEIYEGDIIEEDIDFNSKMTDGTFRYKVYWNEDELCWSLNPIGPESIHDDLWELNSSRRVIGNAHENKELWGESV